jgi:hypothetical protein
MGAKWGTPFERLMRRTVKTDSCWLWQGCRGPSGHGQIGLKVHGIKRLDATHRVAWRHYFGDIPSGLCVLHKCDVANCVNPEHLFLGSRTDNSEDKCRKGRVPKGTELPQSKLNPDTVRWIRSSSLPQREIARMLNVSQVAVSQAKTGARWGWLT